MVGLTRRSQLGRGRSRPRWMGDQRDKVVLVTGANSGVGFAVAEAFALAGASVIMAVRSRPRGEAARDRIMSYWARGPIVGSLHAPQIHLISMDMADLDSVARGAQMIASRWDRLDLCVNNAGIMAVPRSTNNHGIERQFATNHLGHFALIGHLLALLAQADHGRVVTVGSLAAAAGHLEHYDPRDLSGYHRMNAYRASKLANVVYAQELERRFRSHGYASLRSVAAHPGLARSNLTKGYALGGTRQWMADRAAMVITQSARRGALPILRAATDVALPGGTYIGPAWFKNCYGPAIVQPWPKSSQTAGIGPSLWELSERLSGVRYLSVQD